MCTKTIVTTDRFEEKGVELQENARSFGHAVQNFNKSCTLCTLYKRRADCESCPVREAMKSNIEWFGVPKDYPWVKREFGEA